jgi:hypothetical protein
VNRILLVAATALAIVAAACGGGGGTSSTPPPPTGNFSNASLKGSYAFSMSGEDPTPSFLARVGSFTADGNGNITAALEDVNIGGTARQAISFTGTYSIQPNGKGTLTLNGALGGGLQLSIALNSPTQGVMIQTDLAATSSGSFTLQSPAAFSNPGIAGSYVFDVSGATSNGAPASVVGQAVTDGNGNVTGGVFDSNDGNSTGPSGPLTMAASTYAVDATANGTTFGRGTMTLAGLSFVFYIVDNTHIKLLEEDTIGNTLGDALKQPGGIPTTTAAWNAGNFVFAIGGSALGTAGPVSRAGRFTTSGSGTLSTVALNDNDNGSVSSTTTLSNAVYAIDTTTGIVGSGRGTLTFTDSNLGTFSYVFYLVSPTQAVIQDISNGIIGDGTLLAQSGTISASSLAGNYIFNWSGVIRPSSGNVGFEEDFVGQYAEASSASLSGAVDFVSLGTTSSHSPLFSNSAVSGMFTLNGDGSGSNDYQLTISTAGVSANTFHFKAYIAAGNVVFLVNTDSNQILAGNASPQP